MILSPQLLLNAYAQGIFPMADETGDIGWYRPVYRAIIPLDGLHVSRSLRRTLRQQPYEIRINHAFRQVMEQCARPMPGREETWISPEIIDAYCRLHDLGYAHSVECWSDRDELVGGLYGVALRGLFAGESMFSQARDASKIALYHLVQRLNERGFSLLDTQYVTDHLVSMGAVEIPAAAYDLLLKQAVDKDVTFV